MWMGLWFVLLASLPIIYNFYNVNNQYLPIIPMQSSLLQTCCFILFMLSMYCTASMLPCGRYYYAPEGGYVGNPWVKFSYQYAYLYMAWIVHHLDTIEHYGFQFAQTFARKCFGIYDKTVLRNKYRMFTTVSFKNFEDPEITSGIRFKNNNYNLPIFHSVKYMTR